MMSGSDNSGCMWGYRLSVKEVVVCFHQITSALMLLDQADVVHHDLHLANILVTRDSTAWKLVDFGNAYLRPSSGSPPAVPEIV